MATQMTAIEGVQSGSSSPATLSNLDIVETEALAAWGNYRRKAEPLGLDFGKKMYALREALSARGKDGEGFNAWLLKKDIPRSTAYFWIGRHEESIGIRVVKPKLLRVLEDNPAIATALTMKPLLKGHVGLDVLPLDNEEREQVRKIAEQFEKEVVEYAKKAGVFEPHEMPAHASATTPVEFVLPIGEQARIDAAQAEIELADKSDTELTELLAPMEPAELAVLEAEASAAQASAIEVLPPESKASDTTRLRTLFKGTGLEVKQSVHGNKFLLDGLSFAQCREIATMLGGE
jgi:hypothetical protein